MAKKLVAVHLVFVLGGFGDINLLFLPIVLMLIVYL